jgi:hypothetical protein
MTPPDDLAFLELFEAEPDFLDPSAPWVCNTATYQIDRDGCVVKFQISLSYSNLKAAVTVDGRQVAEAELTAFTSLEIKIDGGSETLIARFGASSASALFLTLKPNVRLSVVASSDS